MITEHCLASTYTDLFIYFLNITARPENKRIYFHKTVYFLLLIKKYYSTLYSHIKHTNKNSSYKITSSVKKISILSTILNFEHRQIIRKHNYCCATFNGMVICQIINRWPSTKNGYRQRANVNKLVLINTFLI